jgi:hypothetical protein
MGSFNGRNKHVSTPIRAGRDGGGRPRGKPNRPNPRNEILQIAGRGKHFARRAPLLLFLPPPPARAPLFTNTLFPVRRLSSPPISSSSLLAPIHVPPNPDPPPPPPPTTTTRPTRRPPPRLSPATRFAPSSSASTLRIRRYRTCLSSCRNVAISLFFPFFERHLSRFIVCANPSIAEFLTPCLRFFPLCTRWSRPEQRLYRGMRCLFLE